MTFTKSDYARLQFKLTEFFSKVIDRHRSFFSSPINFAARRMPRRPRPASREKLRKEQAAVNGASGSKLKLPLPKATSKRSLKVADPEPESDEENDDASEVQSSDSDESKSSDYGSPGDSDEDEEFDVDVDAPRVAQWVDEEDLDQPEVPSGDASYGKTVDLEDMVCYFILFSN